jgi:hypothetical protein
MADSKPITEGELGDAITALETFAARLKGVTALAGRMGALRSSLAAERERRATIADLDRQADAGPTCHRPPTLRRPGSPEPSASLRFIGSAWRRSPSRRTRRRAASSMPGTPARQKSSPTRKQLRRRKRRSEIEQLDVAIAARRAELEHINAAIREVRARIGA